MPGLEKEGRSIADVLRNVIEEGRERAKESLARTTGRKKFFSCAAGLLGIAGFGTIAGYADDVYDLIQEKSGGYFDFSLLNSAEAAEMPGRGYALPNDPKIDVVSLDGSGFGGGSEVASVGRGFNSSE